MFDASSARDRIRANFEAATNQAYDVDDILAVFWLYALPLVKLEAPLIEPKFQDKCEVIRSSIEQIDEDSFKRDGFLEPDVKRISELPAECDAIGFSKLANILRRYYYTLVGIGNDPPSTCWCQYQLRNAQCAKCGFEGRYLFWSVVNTLFRPDLAVAARSGSICRGPLCHFCDEPIGTTNFFYCNPEREEFILFWPYEIDEDQAMKTCGSFLEAMPIDFRGGKSQIVYLKGFPAASFREGSVAGITCVKSVEQFVQSVTEPVMFDVELLPSSRSGFEEYDRGKRFAEDGDWLRSASAFARSFLLDPVTVSFLRNISSCLRNLGRKEDADAIDRDAERLYGFLIKAQIICRIQRWSDHRGMEGEDLHLQILKSGFPAEWNLAGLIRRLRVIASESMT